MRIAGEILAYALFAAVVGLMSVWPKLEVIDEQQAMISLSIVHAGQRIGECRTLTQDELNELPPNMRKPNDCPRERHPVRVLLRSDDHVLYEVAAAPTGFWSDGKSNVYRRVVVDAGPHVLFVGINDTGGEREFDYELEQAIDISPGQNITVRFDELEQQLRIR